MKNPFKVGERVACYSGLSRVTGKIVRVEDGYMEVRQDNSDWSGLFSVKQCRRLFKRKRTRIWVNFHLHKFTSSGVYDGEVVSQEWKEFIEVKRK